jgi:hypothetical protein
MAAIRQDDLHGFLAAGGSRGDQTFQSRRIVGAEAADGKTADIL